jgi:hypothetical protein
MRSATLRVLVLGVGLAVVALPARQLSSSPTPVPGADYPAAVVPIL